MVQKRYQWISREGIVWTEWFNYNEDDNLLPALQKNEKYQLLHPTLKNEFRVV